MAQERAHGCELAADGRRCEAPAGAASGAEQADVFDERAHVDVVERRSLRLEPPAELRHVDAVRAAGASRKRAAAVWASTKPGSTPVLRRLRRTVQCWRVSHAARVWIALATIYLIWGSTYLGIELTGATIPPLFGAAVRFAFAGLLMAAIATWGRGARASRVTRTDLASCALIGVLLPGANAMLFVAERNVPTGLASLIIGSV